MLVTVNRKAVKFHPDFTRDISRFIYSYEEMALNPIRSVINMTEQSPSQALNPILKDSSWRYRNISKVFEKYYNKVSHLIKLLDADPDSLDISKKTLIGSYFIMEYIGRLKTPLQGPNAEERVGYVPNVVYTCGSLLHKDELIISCAMSDYASPYATVNLHELSNEFRKTNQEVYN